MISKEDFLALYEKFNAGNCTPDEIALLDAYQDEMHIDDGRWPHHDRDIHKVRARILTSINQNSNKSDIRRPVYMWFKVAAVTLVTVALGLLFTKHHHQPVKQLAANQHHDAPLINPGSNNAVLITANGKRIVLNDIKQGKVAVQAGMQVSKSNTGMLVYNFKAEPAGQGVTEQTAYNTIVTPRGGQYQVILSDGTRVWLNSASSLRFPVNFTGDKRNVELTGEAYFEVTKNKYKPFMVAANGTNVQVLGTHFNVEAYADNGAVKTTLLEGSVRLEKGQETAMLRPGDQGVIYNTKTGINVKNTVDVEEVMAWKNGYFIFHDENITNIMKQVSRWYDVDVTFADDVVKNREFGGTISRYKNITELLDNMQLTHAIHYKIEERRVIIMR